MKFHDTNIVKKGDNMNIQKLNEELKEILKIGKELTTVNEEIDLNDTISKKHEDIINILKTQIDGIFEEGLFEDINQNIGDFNIWTNACHFFANRFKLIDDCLAKIDSTNDTEEIEFYNKYINKYLEEIDNELTRLQNIEE